MRIYIYEHTVVHVVVHVFTIPPALSMYVNIYTYMHSCARGLSANPGNTAYSACEEEASMMVHAALAPVKTRSWDRIGG